MVKFPWSSATTSISIQLSIYSEIKFNLLGPVGDKVEEWVLKGAFLTAANFNDLSMDDGAAVADISLTIRYDYAILSF